MRYGLPTLLQRVAASCLRSAGKRRHTWLNMKLMWLHVQRGMVLISAPAGDYVLLTACQHCRHADDVPDQPRAAARPHHGAHRHGKSAHGRPVGVSVLQSCAYWCDIHDGISSAVVSTTENCVLQVQCIRKQRYCDDITPFYTPSRYSSLA